MKSPQIQEATYLSDIEKRKYSDLQVLQSAAGWYIGTLYNSGGFPEPGSRDSDYFSTKAEAEHHLAFISEAECPEENLRNAP